MNFEISVIIPVYNASQYLEKSVLSAINLPEVKEVILIEDGSMDESFVVCKKLESEFEKIKLFQHPNGVNKGAGASRNLGLKLALFDYIAFLDADDFYLSHRFTLAKEILQKTIKVEGVFEAIGTYFYSDKAKQVYTKANLTTINENFLNEHDYFTTLVCGRGFTHLNGLTIRRSVLQKKINFDEELIQSQDADFLFNLALQCNMQAGNLDQAVAMRGVHETNRIHDLKKANFYANILAIKWIRKSKNSNWENRIIYNLVIMYIETSLKPKPLALINLVIQNPFLILKFNPLDLIRKLK